MKSTALIAKIHHLTRGGDHRCYYCGAPCDGTLPSREYVRPTFTGRSMVACPGSDSVCAGCVEGLFGPAIVPGKANAQKRRNYSWVITDREEIPVSKADLTPLVRACLEPPEPPYAIIAAVSGQKHLLHLAPVNTCRERVCVQFEEEMICFAQTDLAELLALCRRICLAAGKPALAGPLTSAAAAKIEEVCGDDWEPLIMRWQEVCRSPLAGLAAWLTPGRETLRRRDKEESWR